MEGAMQPAPGSDRWKQISKIFYAALDVPTAERTAFLDQACAGHPELREEVVSLLASSDQTLDFAQKAVLEVAKHQESQSELAGKRLGSYQLLDTLGKGGMGKVYLAEDTRLKRKVAVKVLTSELVRDERALHRFEQEALAASALNHPNILTIFEFAQVDGLNFIVSEYVEGTTLREKVHAGRLDPGVAIEIAIQMGTALAAAHESGIIHRDVKPDNVIVRKDGIVKVLDFGIAKLGEKRREAVHRGPGGMSVDTTGPGVVMGTAKYMSPEQSRGLEVDGRSDVFSLGTVLYEMLAGHAAFEGQTTSDVIAEILKSDPPPLADSSTAVPPQLETIVTKAMAKHRSERYQTMKEFVSELQNFKNEMEFQAKLHGARPFDPYLRPKSGNSPRSGEGHTGETATLDRLPTPFAASARGRWTGTKMAAVAVVALLIAVGGYFGYRRVNRGVAEAPVRSLAILPFRNLRQDPETDFLGFSLADAVITKLGYIKTFIIRPSSSVDKYRNQLVDPKKVAADLNVDVLLTGNFIKEGDTLRITTQLIDVKPDKILWQDSFDVTYDKLLTVQDRVSEQIIKGLELNLSPAEAESLKPEKPINGVAYEYYLRGVDLYALNDFSAAIQMLEKSVAIEPNYALTWAHLGRAYTTDASLQFGGRERYRKAQQAYEKALGLNPGLIEPRIYLSNLLTDTGRVEEAVPLVRSVLAANPNVAEAHWELGYAYRFGGMLPESVAECEKARQNNPQVKINSSALNAYLYEGEYEKFMQSLPVNDSAYIVFYHGLGNYYLGKSEQARSDFDRAYDSDPGLLPAQVGKALSFAIQHKNAEGLEFLRQTTAKLEGKGVMDAEGIYKVAQAHAVLGDKASALRTLRRSIEGGFFCYPYFMRDPLLNSLRNEDEFNQLMSQAQQRHEQFKARFF